MAFTRSLRTVLDTFQNIFTNSLNSSSSRAPTPAAWRPGCELSLKPHQVAELQRMEDMETQLPNTMKIGSDELCSQYAFLSDPIGTGKTVTALLHIARMKQVARHPRRLLHRDSTPLFYTITEDIERPFRLYNTLIVVPHTLYLQWESQIQTFTTLKPLFLRTTRDLKHKDLFQSLEQADCVLISNTLLRAFMLECHERDPSITWRRVYYDEADTIRIPNSCLRPLTYFTWFITSSPQHFLFSRKFIHSHQIQNLSSEEIESYHPQIQRILRNHQDSHPVVTYFRIQSDGFFSPYIQNQHPLRYSLVLIADDAFLRESIQYPPFTQTIVNCAPVTIAYRDGVLRPEIVQLLKAGNIRSAYEALHLRAYMTQKTEQLQHHLQSDCPVCYDKLRWTLITPCCARPFCAECICTCLTNSTFCPLCRDQIDSSQLMYLEEQDPFTQTEDSIQLRLPTKYEAFIQLLRENPNGRFLIYDQHQSFMVRLSDAMRSEYPLGQAPRIGFLRGSKTIIASQIRNFESGVTPLLFCNSFTAIQGLNLQYATHIVFLHHLRDIEKSNIIRRAWRLGRTAPLSVYELQSKGN